MITDAILSFFVLPIYGLLSILPDINFSFPTDIFDNINSIFANIGFLLPVTGLIPLFILSLSIASFSIIWSMILRIKSFIPTMGH